MKNTLDLENAPSPSGEAEEFSTLDENKDKREKRHEIEILRLNQGFIGSLIGSTNTSLTITFLVLVFSFIVLISVFFVSYFTTGFQISERIIGVISLLCSIITLCIGYIFGSK